MRPPGPRGPRLAGNLGAYEADRLGFLTWTREAFGGLVAFDRRTTIVHDPDLVGEVLRDTGERFLVRENYLLRRVSDAERAETARLRPLLNPGLRPSAVEGVAPAVADLLDRRLDESALEAAFDPQPLMEDVLSTAVATFFFGPDAGSLPAATGVLLDALACAIGNPFAMPSAWPTPANRRIRRRHAEVKAVVEDLLRRRARSPALYDDYATSVVLAGARACSLGRLADLLIGSLLAAQRVPAAACGWMLMLAADHPGAQDELIEEARLFHAARESGAGFHVESAPRTLAFVLESLRLYPATWLLTRTAATELSLGGYVFEPGHHFLISPYVLHRDERNFVDPLTFEPGRWRDHRPPSRLYLPFGRGLNRCPGSDLALTALVAVLLTMVRRGRVTRLPGEVFPDPRTTLLPRGLALVLDSRAAVRECRQG